MRVKNAHPFNVTPPEAREIQINLSRKLILKSEIKIEEVNVVAAADVSYSKEEDKVYGVVVLLSFPDFSLIEKASFSEKASFPYIPGLLVFREGPSLLKAFEKINTEPDIILFDGHGISHPRGFGIASHLGVILDKPSIGVAKKVLVGEYVEPGEKRGSTSPLLKNGHEIGRALRTKDKVAPIFVSIGHKVDLDTAVKFVLLCARKHRLPEPLRIAHIYSNEVRKKEDTEELRLF
jgi:deoxyribonuclease V